MAPTWKFEKVNSFYKIITPDLIDRLSNELCDFWSGEQHDKKIRFPGAQPVSIEKNDIKTIKSLPYVICAKLDGERYILLLTQVPEDLNDPNSKKLNINFVVNRNLDFFIVTISGFPGFAYENKTIFDGELLNNEFIIHDAINIGGDIVKKENWESRWRKTDAFLTTVYKYTPSDSFFIKLKKFYDIKQLKDLFNDIETNNIKTDGIIFYPMNDPVRYRSQTNLYKWKPPGHHTIDFKIRIENSSVIMESWSSSKTFDYMKLPIYKFSNIQDLKNGDVIEFNTKIVNRVAQFTPIIKRVDKEVGNNLYTVKKTIQNVKENITKDFLLLSFS